MRRAGASPVDCWSGVAHVFLSDAEITVFYRLAKENPDN
jgi:hypothetical protein